MPTPATIAITPGAGQLLDAISVTVGLNTVVRETMVLADPTSPTELATISGGALSVFLPTSQVTTLTPPTAAAIAAAIVANPPTVPISGTVGVTQSTNPWVVSNGGTFAVQASITTLGQQLAAASVPVVLTAAQLATLTPLTTVAVTQSTSPWVGNITQFASTVLGTPQAFGSAPTGIVIGTSSDMYIAGTRARSNQTTTAAGVQDVNLVGALGATMSATNPIFSAVTDGTNKAAVKAASTAATATDPALVVTTNGSTTAGACANTSVTSGSSTILAANTARREVTIVNTDIVVVYLGFGQTPTATAYHVALSPCTNAHDGTGGTYVSDIWKGDIRAITASTSGHVAVMEMT